MKTGAKTNKPRSGLVAALDVGTTKVCCLIARPDVDRGAYGDKGPRVVGIGHQVSKGLRNGAVIDLDEAEASIRAVVEAAEQMAGENIDSVVVNLSGGRHRSRLIAYEISIAGHEIGEADLRSVLDPANLAGEKSDDREFIHTIPVGYTVDGSRGVVDPRGMYGERLGVNT
ncbi:MAG: cell division protein FtsA, partial [Magnetovibrio sp.]|nr:cell division protein FtsA [Magnetovibrio sp.]